MSSGAWFIMEELEWGITITTSHSTHVYTVKLKSYSIKPYKRLTSEGMTKLVTYNNQLRPNHP